MPVKHLKSLLLTVLLSCIITAAQADDLFSFQGGSGSPFSVTLSTPIRVVFNSPAVIGGLGLNLKNVYPTILSGSSINVANGLLLNGPGLVNVDISVVDLVIPAGNWGSNGKEIELYFSFSGNKTFSAGDSLLISPGTATTTQNVASPIPNPVMPYTLVVSDNFAMKVDATASPVPEPHFLGQFAVLGLFVILLLPACRRV